MLMIFAIIIIIWSPSSPSYDHYNHVHHYHHHHHHDIHFSIGSTNSQAQSLDTSIYSKLLGVQRICLKDLSLAAWILLSLLSSDNLRTCRKQAKPACPSPLHPHGGQAASSLQPQGGQGGGGSDSQSEVDPDSDELREVGNKDVSKGIWKVGRLMTLEECLTYWWLWWCCWWWWSWWWWWWKCQRWGKEKTSGGERHPTMLAPVNWSGYLSTVIWWAWWSWS